MKEGVARKRAVQSCEGFFNELNTKLEGIKSCDEKGETDVLRYLRSRCDAKRELVNFLEQTMKQVKESENQN